MRIKMSFRETRNFIELLKALGYRRHLSFESFRSSNFCLIAEISTWLVRQFDANYCLPDDYSNSENRVLLIKIISEFMTTKLGLKINPKKLYMADGHAVKEMLKITSLLHNAKKMQKLICQNELTINIDLSAKVQELKFTRELGIQITRKGSSLYELLAQEPNLRECRRIQANKHIDINEVELIIRNIILDTEKNSINKKQEIDEFLIKEQSLKSKIDMKNNDLKRISQRLEILKGFGPKRSEEYERYEQELSQAYENYVVKFRCYIFLQQHFQQMCNFNQNIIESNLDTKDHNCVSDKMPSIFDDCSHSSNLSTPENPTNDKAETDTLVKNKPTIRRIQTAVDARKSGRKMYDDALDDTDDSSDEDNETDVNVNLGDKLLLDESDQEDSDSELSDLENQHSNDEDKSDDSF